MARSGARASGGDFRVRGNRGLSLLGAEVGFSEHELTLLIRAKEMLFKVRNALHAISGAERDQLVVTRQEEVAAALGYVSAGAEYEGYPRLSGSWPTSFPRLRCVAEWQIAS